VTRPRVRAADGSGELHLPGCELFSSTEILGQKALEKMLAGLSSRRYGHGLEPAGQAVEARAAPASKSAVAGRGAWWQGRAASVNSGVKRCTHR